MSDLRSRTIRLAHSQPHLRPHLIPLLQKQALEGPLHKPGDVWHTDNGKWRSQSPDGKAKTFDTQDKAKAHAKPGKGDSKDSDSSKLKEMTGFSSVDDVESAWEDTYGSWKALSKDEQQSKDGKNLRKGLNHLTRATNALDDWKKAQKKLIQMGDDLENPESDEGKEIAKDLQKHETKALKALKAHQDHAQGYSGFKGKLKKMKDKAVGFGKNLMQNLRGKKACQTFDRMASSKTASTQQDLVLVRRAIRVAYDNPEMRPALVPVLVEYLCEKETL